MLASTKIITKTGLSASRRWASTAVSADKDKFKIVVVGAGEQISLPSMRIEVNRGSCHSVAGSGGLTVANQIYNRFKAAGKPLNDGDVAIIDAAEYHYYQVSLSFCCRLSWLY